MGKSSRRDRSKKSRAQLLARINNTNSNSNKSASSSSSTGNGNHSAPPQDRPSSTKTAANANVNVNTTTNTNTTWNSTSTSSSSNEYEYESISSNMINKIIPLLVQFAVTWIIIIGCMKGLKSFGYLDLPSQQQQQQQQQNDVMNSNSTINDLGTNLGTGVGLGVAGKVLNDITSSSSSTTVQRFKLDITPELQRKFHPVIKFPIKTVFVEDDNNNDNEPNKPKKVKKVKKVKKQIYRILDFSSTSGSTQLVPKEQQQQFIKQRQKEQKESKKQKQKLNFFSIKRNTHEHSYETQVENSIYAVSKYNEDRKKLYSSQIFEKEDYVIDGYGNTNGGGGGDGSGGGGKRTIHMGIDLGAPIQTKVYSFYNGIVHSVGYNPELGDYGYVIVIQYTIPITIPSSTKTVNNKNIWALYGHLDKSTIKKKVGQRIKKGQVVGRIGDVDENGGWKFPHVHFQLSTIEPKTHDMPGAVGHKDRDKALEDYPDPRLVLGPLY